MKIDSVIKKVTVTFDSEDLETLGTLLPNLDANAISIIDAMGGGEHHFPKLVAMISEIVTQ
jgi:hypothetical protein